MCAEQRWLAAHLIVGRQQPVLQRGDGKDAVLHDLIAPSQHHMKGPLPMLLLHVRPQGEGLQAGQQSSGSGDKAEQLEQKQQSQQHCKGRRGSRQLGRKHQQQQRWNYTGTNDAGRAGQLAWKLAAAHLERHRSGNM